MADVRMLGLVLLKKGVGGLMGMMMKDHDSPQQFLAAASLSAVD
jgi:hypothetical protein